MGELVRGGESPAMANADQQGMQAPEKYQGWKPAKKEASSHLALEPTAHEYAETSGYPAQ